MSLVLDLLSVIAIVAGAVFYLAGTVFFFYCSGDHRHLHAFPTRRTPDLALVVVGLLLQVDSVLGGLKLVLVWLLVLLSSAVVSQLIARTTRRRDMQQ